MKLSIKRLFFFSILVIMAVSAASCNLPIKIVANTSKTNSIDSSEVPVAAATTPPSPSGEAQATAVPEGEIITLDDLIVPVAGDVLTWIDLSEFVYVPAGVFTMGHDEEIPSDHAPAHTVSLDGFWIHQAEVTNQQYAACVAAGLCTVPAHEVDTPYWYTQSSEVNAPVVGVTWTQASQYCEYIQSRIPSEAEWEYTARGTENRTYPWGEDEPTCSLLNYDNCLEPSAPEDVRSYPDGASEFKAMDLSGNVFEWVNDWYEAEYYATSPAVNPLGPTDGLKRVYRGGGYSTSPENINPVMRFSLEPEEHAANIGFRCVLNGDFNTGSGNQVPRQCEVVPVNNYQPQEQPTWTPMPCLPATLNGNCYLNNSGSPVTSISISQSGCQNNLLSAFSSTTIIDLNCSGPLITGDWSIYQCNGKNMIQGASVDLSYCHQYLLSQFVPECPPGYEYDALSKFCMPNGSWLPEPPCPTGYIEVSGKCLPDPSTNFQSCSVGFYLQKFTFGSQQITVCIPLDQCLLQTSTKSCDPPVCPAGQTYDPTNQCCSSPDKLRQVCPTGFSLQTNPNTQQISCEIPDLFGPACETRNVVMSYCPTLTPTPTNVPASSNPCTHYSETECRTHKECTWIPGAVGSGGHCE
jgi:formylglycine-generating enzyme